jgi:hypothetical protein
VYFWSALNINYVGGPSIEHSYQSWFQLTWWFHRRRLKCKSLRTTADANRWLCIAWPFGSSELIRCYQTSHLFQHRDPRNVLPTDATRDVGLIAATDITPTDSTLCRYIIGFTEFCLKYFCIFLLWQEWWLWEGLTCGIALLMLYVASRIDFK